MNTPNTRVTYLAQLVVDGIEAKLGRHAATETRDDLANALCSAFVNLLGYNMACWGFDEDDVERKAREIGEDLIRASNRYRDHLEEGLRL